MKDLLAKIDEDEEWFPGKQYGAKRGRKRVLTGAKSSAVARCAKATKGKGGEPTYGHICGNCPDAVINPETGRPVDKRAVYTVFRERCYDDDEHPENTRMNRARLSRKALTEEMRVKRYNWAVWMLALRHTAKWYFDNLVWTCFERSEHAAGDETDVYHGHMYFLWTDDVGVHLENLDALKFLEVIPRVDRCVAPPGRFRLAALHGLWYVAVMKTGTVYSDTNYLAWRKYRPFAAWLVGLWDDHKLTHEQFLTLSATFRSGHAKRKRDALEAMRDHDILNKGVLRRVS